MSALEKLINRNLLGTLREPGLLDRNEREFIDKSVKEKYVPAIRNAILMTLLAAPGFLTDPQSASILYGVTTTLTGMAWFGISLKEIKVKLADFGNELTEDLLEAFMGSMFILTSSTIVQQTGLEGKNLGEKIPDELEVILQALPILVTINIARKLVMATIKFDTNDTLLTGSTEASQNFFRESTSRCLKVADQLQVEHGLVTANFLIAEAIQQIYKLTTQSGLGVWEEDPSARLFVKTTSEQKEFDVELIPILRTLVSLIEKMEPDNSTKIDLNTANELLRRLEKSYSEGIVTPQDASDNSIAVIFRMIGNHINRCNGL